MATPEELKKLRDRWSEAGFDTSQFDKMMFGDPTPTPTGVMPPPGPPVVPDSVQPSPPAPPSVGVPSFGLPGAVKEVVSPTPDNLTPWQRWVGGVPATARTTAPPDFTVDWGQRLKDIGGLLKPLTRPV